MLDALKRYEDEIREAKARLSSAIRALEPEPVREYTLKYGGSGSPVRFSELFGASADLVVVHNMGRKCVYCTLWADCLSSMYKHLANRCAFVLTTPDDPIVAGEFASARGWTFPVVSHAGTSFAEDMGYNPARGEFHPGISGFRKLENGDVVRTATRRLGPGDDYCAVWPIFDLLSGGVGKWEPKYAY